MARELTEKEKKRTELFKETTAKMQDKGYSVKPITIGVVEANVMAVIVMLPLVAVVAAVYYLAGGSFYFPDYWEFMFVFLLGVVSMPVHEFIHGITWGLFAENHMKDIEYGFIVQMLTPYCTCLAPLKKNQYIIGSMMPTLVLGVLIAVVGILTNSFWVILLSVFNIWGGGGDFNIIIRLLRYNTKGKDVIFIDHPTEVGLVAFEKEKTS